MILNICFHKWAGIQRKDQVVDTFWPPICDWEYCVKCGETREIPKEEFDWDGTDGY